MHGILCISFWNKTIPNVMKNAKVVVPFVRRQKKTEILYIKLYLNLKSDEEICALVFEAELLQESEKLSIAASPPGLLTPKHKKTI